MKKDAHKSEFSFIKEVIRPSGYSAQLYTYEGVYHVRINSPLGHTMQNREFDVVDEALVYFDQLAAVLSDDFYK